MRQSIGPVRPQTPDVHPRAELPAAMLRLAREQAGVLSGEQAQAFGVSRNVLDRLLRADQWHRLAVGIYLTVPIDPSWEALAWGGVLLGGDRSRLGPEASGYLHGLVPAAPRTVDVLVPDRVRVQGPWRFIRESPGARSDRAVGAPSRLRPATTVLDLANDATRGHAIGLLTTVAQRRLASPRQILDELADRRVHRHRRLIGEVLAEVRDGVESPLEYRYVRDVERPHGLPRGARQKSRSGLPYRIDVDYRLFALLVELDGLLDHEGLGRARDMNRDNLHALVGAITLRFGWLAVADRPCAVAWQVHVALRQRGFSEPFQRCVHCAGVPEEEFLWL